MADVDEAPIAKPNSQKGQRFGRCELGTDTGPWARTERQILVAMTAVLFREAADVERVRVVP